MSDLTGKTLGRYRIVERIGRGGMADVYKAYQPSLDRYVAIKVLHPFLLEEDGSRERFQRVHRETRGHRVVVGRVEAVHGVHDHRHAGCAAHDPAVDPGLRVVGVQHVDAFASEHVPQLAGGACVATWVRCPGRRRGTSGRRTRR